MSDIVEVQPEITGSEAPNQPLADPNNADSVETTNQTDGEASASDRPEWLPEKFQSAEDLANAYQELESKMGSGDEQQVDPEEGTAEPPQTSDEWQQKFEPFTYELQEKGELSDGSYKELADMGYPRELVDGYIAGQEAVSSREEGQVMDSIGGESNFQSMIEWAKDNVPESELDAYNRSVMGGDVNDAKMAVQGMYARYTSATGGQAPQLLTGQKGGSGGLAIRSNAELVDLMSDPRYAKDPAYRADVQRRLNASDLLG
jgi:hypothetical protein